jgi:hypothetical protein
VGVARRFVPGLGGVEGGSEREREKEKEKGGVRGVVEG